MIKTAKVREYASGEKVIIIQVYVKEIAMRYTQVVGMLLQQVKMIRKRMTKVMYLKTERKMIIKQKCCWQIPRYLTEESC